MWCSTRLRIERRVKVEDKAFLFQVRTKKQAETDSGRSIENPFEDQAMDTPMTALATTIERDLKVAIGEEPPPRATPNDRGILM